MFTRDFWLGDNGALTRAIRTWAQSFIAAVGVSTTNLFSADIKSVMAVSVSAALISLIMSLDRRESLLSPPPTARATLVSDPSAANFQPLMGSAGGCGGDMR